MKKGQGSQLYKAGHLKHGKFTAPIGPTKHKGPKHGKFTMPYTPKKSTHPKKVATIKPTKHVQPRKKP